MRDIKFERFMDYLAGQLYHRNRMENAVPLTYYSFKDDKVSGPRTMFIKGQPTFEDPPEPWWVRFILWAAGTNAL